MSLVFYIGLVLSAIVGVSLGLVGGGGSILTVPILVYFLGVDAHEAVGMSLAVVGATSLFGAWLHHRKNNVNFAKGSLFGIAGVFGAFLGAPLTKLVPPNILLLIFGVLMFVVAVSMLWRSKQAANKTLPAQVLWKAIAAGFGVGFLTGFLGIGGGFLIVPALVMFGGLTMKKAVGTSLLVIFLNSAAGFVGQMSQNHFNWSLTVLLIILAVGGVVFGTILSHRLAANRLQKMFAVLVLAVSLFLFAKNYAVLF